MATLFQSPIDILERQISESDELIRAEQDRNKLLRAKLEGMQEFAAFGAANLHGVRISVPQEAELHASRRRYFVHQFDSVTNSEARAATLSSGAFTGVVTLDTASEPKAAAVPKKRREISATWKPFFKLAESLGGATMQDFEKLAKEKNIEYRLLRTQLKYYLDTDLMVRLGEKFVLSSAGKEVARIEHDYPDLTQLDFPQDQSDASDLV